MIFWSKYERALNFVREKMKDKEKTFEHDDMKNVMEKGDKLAMIIAALITILPIVLLILIAVTLLAYFFVVRGG